MKQLFTVICVILICASMAISSCAIQDNSYVISSADTVIEIGHDKLQGVFGGKRIMGITVMEIPDPEIGMLICEGVAVEPYDYLDADALDWLVYETCVENSVSRISLLADLPKALHASITIISGDDSAATVTMPADLYAWRQVMARYYSGASLPALLSWDDPYGL